MPSRSADADGFVDTGDMLELRGDRYYFVGRRDGVINVGGLKVHPEEVEAVINRHPQVQDVAGAARKSPITGALVVADVVLTMDPATVNGQAEQICSTKFWISAAERLPGIRFRPRSTLSATCRSPRPERWCASHA